MEAEGSPIPVTLVDDETAPAALHCTRTIESASTTRIRVKDGNTAVEEIRSDPPKGVIPEGRCPTAMRWRSCQVGRSPIPLTTLVTAFD